MSTTASSTLNNFYFSGALGQFSMNYMPYAIFLLVMGALVCAMSLNWKSLLLVENNQEPLNPVDKL